MARSFVLAMFFVTFAAVGATTAHAQGSDRVARAHFEDGRAAYEGGRFAEAATSFEQAYRLTNRTALLYNIYLAYRDAGDDVKAADAMRRYLATLAPDASERPQLEARLHVHEARLAAASHASGPSDVDTTSEDTPATDPSRVVEPSPDTTESTDIAADVSTNDDGEEGSDLGVIPWVIAGGGAALVVGGLIVGALAMSAKSELDDLCPTMMTCDPGYEDVQSRGQTLAMVSDVLWISGAAVAVTGLVLAIIDSSSGSREADRPSTASLACTSDGCAVAVAGRF